MFRLHLLGDLARTSLALLSFFLLLGIIRADEPQKTDPDSKDEPVINSKAVRRVSASSINYRKELNLPFPSLSTLGSRIDAARRAPDPVVLANAASELGVAEKVSGKHAALTSNALIKEAAEVARLRRKVAELQAVARVN